MVALQRRSWRTSVLMVFFFLWVGLGFRERILKVQAAGPKQE
jgi:hypothetical protein